VTPVRQATVFFSVLVVTAVLGMVYGVVRPELAVGVLAAVGLPIALWLAHRGLALAGSGCTAASARSSRYTKRRPGWWVLAAGLVALFALNLVGSAHISRAAVAGAEGAGLAAGTAYVFRMKRRERA
jgi:hypothetical protein